MKRLLFPCVVVALLSGCATTPRHTLGKPAPNAAPAAVGTVLAAASAPATPVLLHGTMVEKCPSAGCWLRLKDDTGVVKVDLRATGATVTDVPVGTEMAVTGTQTQVGDETTVTASGITY